MFCITALSDTGVVRWSWHEVHGADVRPGYNQSHVRFGPGRGGRRDQAFRQDLTGSGDMLNGAGAGLPEDTRTIRRRADGSTTTDGPFNKAVGQLTACYVIDCASPERTQAIAGRVLDFHITAIEVRLLHDSFGMGDT